MQSLNGTDICSSHCVVSASTKIHCSVWDNLLCHTGASYQLLNTTSSGKVTPWNVYVIKQGCQRDTV